MADDSLVMYAMWLNPDGVKQAIAEGANPDATDAQGNSALSLAARTEAFKLLPGTGRQPETTRALLEAGADADKGKRVSPLESVLEVVIANYRFNYNAFKNVFPLIKLLLRHGATMPEDALSKVPPEHKEELRAEAAYQRRRPLLEARYGPGGPMHKRGTMAPKEAGRRRKTVRRRKTKSSRRRIR